MVLGWFGPSPRGWGEHVQTTRFRIEGRTIPTWVGRTWPRWTETCRRADHPHVGGENRSVSRSSARPCGPSPRGWGERKRLDLLSQETRTIPTWVGRTRGCRWRRGSRADHPHVGGENSMSADPPNPDSGPSPRGWGERERGIRGPRAARTIPTWVGRTPVLPRFRRRSADHPHVGGENPTARRSGWPPSGPSPRGWGERGSITAAGGYFRTIPTWVGRTFHRLASLSRNPDHPHVGGENFARQSNSFPLAGPSPRGWGELHVMSPILSSTRTIPTWVGRT